MTRPQRNIPLFMIGLLLVLVGFTIAMYSLPGLGAMTKDTSRVVVPCDTVIELTRSGDYTIFHETVAVIDGVRYETDAGIRDDMILTLVRTDGSHAIEVRTTPPLSTYSRGGDRRGESAFRFEAEEPGTYELHVEYMSGAGTPLAVLSIAPWSPFAGRLALQVVGGLMIIGVGVVTVFMSNGARQQSSGQYSTNFTYEHNAPCSGAAENVFGIAEKALLPLGFKIEYQGIDTLDATGPGMRSTKQPPILGATRIHFTVGGHELRVRADLGGVRFMRTFLTTFVVGMGLLLVVVVGVLSISADFPKEMILFAAVPIVPWIIIGPFMMRWIRSRTMNAIDDLMANMTTVDRKEELR